MVKGLIKYSGSGSYKIYGDFKIKGSFVICNPVRVEELILQEKKKLSFWDCLSKWRWEWVWKEVKKSQWNFFKIIPEHQIDEIVVFEGDTNTHTQHK